MLEICLLILVTTIIIPCSGWERKLVEEGRAPEVRWSAIFRNASGILRNISSAGIEARTEMRDCEGLVDSFVWTVRASIGKNDIDNKVQWNSDKTNPHFNENPDIAMMYNTYLSTEKVS